jgi:hypothetical protein
MHYGNIFLVLLTALGTLIAWWPSAVQPNLDLPFWVSLACAAGCSGLSTMLTPSIWPSFLLVSGLGTFCGLWLSLLIWPIRGPAVGLGIFYIVGAFTLAVMFVALLAGLIMRRRSIRMGSLRRVVWIALLACVAFGPVTLALTPPLVQRRIARNDRLAAERFASLKKAVETARAEPDGAGEICDGTALERHYAGPPFSDVDWRRITGNYVKQDGYFFMVYCHEKGGYTINAQPARTVGDGTRWFCTDESDRVGCRMTFDGLRYKCLPCAQ